MHTIIFQSAKLGDTSRILDECRQAQMLLDQNAPVERVYGVSGGAMVALAYALTCSAKINPQKWSNAGSAIADLEFFLSKYKNKKARSLNHNPWYGFYNLIPLRKWWAEQLTIYTGSSAANEYANSNQEIIKLSWLSIPLYLCTADRDGTFSLFGPPDPGLTFQYHAVQLGPPQDAPILDALIASLSTLLTYEPIYVAGQWHRDCRPAIVDAGAIVADLQRSSPKDILRTSPHAAVRNWKQNWFTSSFIMHSQNERNQTLLANYYLDLVSRHRELETQYQKLAAQNDQISVNDQLSILPTLGHVDLPYVGSTEASTNMRQSVENREHLMMRFRQELDGQLDAFPFDQKTNIIYGAGGFSGILAGLVTTRLVDAGFEQHGGEIQQIYGVSAGVLNGFFHAVQIAARGLPDLYKPAAWNALVDLEGFIAQVAPNKIANINLYPLRFWQGLANLNPLEAFLTERLAAYTGSKHPEQITFDDIGLPMTIAAARLDGFTDFLGMVSPGRRMLFAGREIRVISAPIIRSMVAGWSMNTYITPTRLGDQSYTDGGGTFYDPAIFVACFDSELINLLNIHLDEPEGHSYNLPPKPNLIRILFDTHNYTFPEERRRMRLLTNLLYDHYRLRIRYKLLLSYRKTDILNLSDIKLMSPDFRQKWDPPACSLDLSESTSVE